MDDSKGMMRIKAADGVEPEIATDLWPLSYLAVHDDSGRVVIHGSGKTP